jgi:peroxiredoxin
LRSIEEHKQQIESRGVKIAAISVDPPQVTKEHAAKQGYSFLFLSDEKLEVIRRYDLLHEGGFRGADIARPAEFLLDPQGVLRWRNLTESYRIRPKGEQLLEALDQAGVPPARSANPNN